MTACATKILQPIRYDRRAASVQVLDFGTYPSGDWLYRREALRVIDGLLSQARFDVLVFQELFRREGVVFDDDKTILQAGVLKGYSWRSVDVRQNLETREVESLGLALGLGLPVKFPDTNEEERLYLGEGSHIAAFTVVFDDQPTAVFNLFALEVLDYVKLSELVESYLNQRGICAKRLLFAGVFPKSGGAGYTEFLSRHGLKDGLSGCLECAGLDQVKILVSGSAKVLRSGLSLPLTPLGGDWPGVFASRFGGVGASVKFAYCR